MNNMCGRFLSLLILVGSSGVAAEKTRQLPIDISAEKGVTFYDDKSYLEALGDVSISRGDSSIYGSKARLDYTQKNNKREMTQLELTGDVLSVSPQVTIYAQVGRYHLPTDKAVYLGSKKEPLIRLLATDGDVFARKKLTYAPEKRLATAVGSAEMHSHKTLHKLFGEEIRLYFKENQTQKAKASGKKVAQKKGDPQQGFLSNEGVESLERLEADTRVKVVLPGKVATGDHARYQTKGNIIELWGNVNVTDENKQLQGAYAIVRKDQGQSEVYSELPPHLKTQKSQKEKKKRVRILLLPS